MTEREQLEDQIRQALANETSAILLSNKLFTPDGLFYRLATTEEERRVVAQSPLFRQALDRLAELRRTEVAEFVRVVQQAQAGAPGVSLFKVERTESK
ncbi:MAG: hypothetical protein HYS12_26555 [Planctomycetes bacterium]|nr:hypothetical protein [Planctomycetota bacterium]